MPQKPRPAFVAFALIGVVEGTLMPPDLAEAIEGALAPGKSVLRYERLWRLPKHTTQGGWIFGRVGFEPPTGSAGVWDEQTQDYRSIRPAYVTKYVIHAATGRVAFELKGGTIEPWTFKGNFQALLNQDSGYRWEVALEDSLQSSWEEWEKSVARVTEVSIRMERPNPRYPGKEVEQLFEMAKLSAATIRVQGDDVEVSDSELLKEAFAHAKKYGRIHAKGVAGPDAKKEEWRSEDAGILDRAQAPRDPATREVSTQSLQGLLEERNQTKPLK